MGRKQKEKFALKKRRIKLSFKTREKLMFRFILSYRGSIGEVDGLMVSIFPIKWSNKETSL